MVFHRAQLVLALMALVSSSVSTSDEMLSLQSVHSSDSMHLDQHFVLGNPGAKLLTYVKIYTPIRQTSGLSLAKRDSLASPPNNGPRIDLTPSNCTSEVCYSGSFEGPSKTDCDVIVAAQLYNSTGSLTAPPGAYVFVHAGTCVVVFQNPIGKPKFTYTFDYNWASLGKIMVELQKKCYFNPDSQSIGAACKIAHYLKYTFHNVVISMQRYTPPEASSNT